MLFILFKSQKLPKHSFDFLLIILLTQLLHFLLQCSSQKVFDSDYESLYLRIKGCHKVSLFVVL